MCRVFGQTAEAFLIFRDFSNDASDSLNQLKMYFHQSPEIIPRAPDH